MLSAYVSDVVFSFGSKPALSRADAQALAQLIAADPNPFTAKLAAKINRALMDGDGVEVVDIERDELAEIADALSADPELLLDVPEFKPLYEEATATLLADSLWLGKRLEGSLDRFPRSLQAESPEPRGRLERKPGHLSSVRRGGRWGSLHTLEGS